MEVLWYGTLSFLFDAFKACLLRTMVDPTHGSI